MTKEDLLRDHDKYAWECDESEHVVPYSAAEKAMDEYAKQQAIAFDEWRIENRWFSFQQGNYYHTFEQGTSMSGKSYNKTYVKTREQLYNQFIEQHAKDK